MGNSFYYFFSAVPQVLGGILALFGVFVLFKIQSIKTELFSIGKVLLQNVQELSINFEIKDCREVRAKLIKDLKRGNDSKNINELKGSIDAVNNSIVMYKNTEFNLYKERYDKMFTFLIDLIRSTIRFSIFTAIIIVVCLIIIPFDYLIVEHNNVLYFLFSIVIIGIVGSFHTLLTILYLSIAEDN
jgi:hypothetical protein